MSQPMRPRFAKLIKEPAPRLSERPQTEIRNPELLAAVTTRGRNELLSIFDNLDEVGRGMLITVARRIEEQRRLPGGEDE